MAEDTKYVQGAQKLSRRIATIRATLALPVLMAETQQLLLRRTLERYEDQVDPDGRKWKPLSTQTLERRRRKGGYPGKKILQQTGELKDAIRVIRGRADGLLAVNTGAGFRIGVDDQEQAGKARAHQSGYGRIPQRRFLGIGALDVKSVDAMLRRRASLVGD